MLDNERLSRSTALYNMNVETGKMIKDIWNGSVFLIHFSGLVFTVFLLLLSLISFAYVVTDEFGYSSMSWFNETYEHIKVIVVNPVSWAAATTIVATTIAVGHMQNLKINKQRFKNEERNRLRKKYMKEEKFRRKQRTERPLI